MTMLTRLSRAVPDWSVLPGVALCILVSAAAFGFARFELHLFEDAWLEPLVLAIIVGTIVRSVWTPPPLFDAGIDFTAHRILEFAVMLLGLSVSAGMIAAAGLALVSGIALLVCIAIVVGLTIGRALGLPWRMACLVACGNAICGNSAIAAIAPVIEAKKEDVVSAIAFTAVFGVVVVLTLPLLGTAIGYSSLQYGALAGLTVYAVPQVIAAAAPMGLTAIQFGTLVKLVRVLMLGPVCIALSLLMTRRRRGMSESDSRIAVSNLLPWFIVGFLLLAAVRSSGLIPEAIVELVTIAATLLTVLSMAALGLGVDIRSLANAGPRVSLTVVSSLGALVLLAMGLIRSIGL